jgi:arylsulfatase A-like enzyme
MPLQSSRPGLVVSLLRFAFAAGLLVVQTAKAAASPPPNILFVFADDQRADTISALGNPHIRTPHLDRLVHQGVSFDRAYMQGGLQAGTCVPSRAMLLSGRNLFAIDETLQRHPTWPAAFAAAGYKTFIAGKWHNGTAALPQIFQSGGSIFPGGMTNPLRARLSQFHDGKLTQPAVTSRHACETFTDDTIAFLQSHPREVPFLCYLAFNGPHDPHMVPDAFPIRYQPESIPLPENFLPQHPFNNGEMIVRDERLLPWPRTEAAVREQLADYYRYISFLDAQLGRLFAALEQSPHADNTIILFAADSGVARGSHGLNGKQNLYEPSIRVPLLVSGPNIPKGKRSDALVYLFDLFPTLGALCRVPRPSTSLGRPFLDTLQNPAIPARDRLMVAYRDVQRALIEPRWKLIRYPHIHKTQLFDLQTDPAETRDLAASPDHAARVADMMQKLAGEQRLQNDTAPLEIDHPAPSSWTPPGPNRSSSKPAGPVAP